MESAFQREAAEYGTEVFPARFTGQAGPKGTGEFYTGVTPGAVGEAEHKTYPGGRETWAFHLPGGAWLTCRAADVQGLGRPLTTDDVVQADGETDDEFSARVEAHMFGEQDADLAPGYDEHLDAAEAAAMHRFVFEAWPPDAGERTLPGRTPVYWAATPREARAQAVADLAATQPGWMVGAGSHRRSLCRPPHPGTDAAPVPPPALAFTPERATAPEILAAYRGRKLTEASRLTGPGRVALRFPDLANAVAWADATGMTGQSFIRTPNADMAMDVCVTVHVDVT
jgi:hypothetical protein